MIDNLCAPNGFARTPPKEYLDRFLDLAQTLNVELVGDLLFETLDQASWIARIKSWCVIEKLLDASGCVQYGEWFEENAEVLIELYENEKKSAVRTKAREVLTYLGIELETDSSSRPRNHQNVVQTTSQPSGGDLLDMMGNMEEASMVPPSSSQFQPPSSSGFVGTGELIQFGDEARVEESVSNPEEQEEGLNLMGSLTISTDCSPAVAPVRNRALSDLGKNLFTKANHSPMAASGGMDLLQFSAPPVASLKMQHPNTMNNPAQQQSQAEKSPIGSSFAFM